MWTIRKPAEAKAPDAERFTMGRRMWDEWVGTAKARERTAYRITAAALALAAFCVWDASQTRSRERINTLVIDRDMFGNPIGWATPGQLRPLSVAQIKDRIGQWIYDVRSVVVDASALRRNLTTAYAWTRDGELANRKITDYHRSDPPHEAAARYTRYVYRVAVLQGQDNTWQADWCEEKRGRDGELISIEAWRASVYFTIIPPTTVKDATENPDGFFVSNFDWTQIKDGQLAMKQAGPGSNKTVVAPQACL